MQDSWAVRDLVLDHNDVVERIERLSTQLEPLARLLDRIDNDRSAAMHADDSRAAYLMAKFIIDKDKEMLRHAFAALTKTLTHLRKLSAELLHCDDDGGAGGPLREDRLHVLEGFVAAIRAARGDDLALWPPEARELAAILERTSREVEWWDVSDDEMGAGGAGKGKDGGDAGEERKKG